MMNAKRLLCLLLTVALCLGLCGCNALDEARAAHAIWQEDGSIRLGDAVYKRLMAGDNSLASVNRDIHVYITEPQVPVLLRARYGQSASLFQDGLFLSFYTADDGQVIYCPEARYEELLPLAEAGFPPTGCYYTYRVTDPDTGEEMAKMRCLTAAELQTVEAVCAADIGITLQESLKREFSVGIMKHSNGIALYDSDYDVYRMEGTYYISRHANNELYPVPKALESAVTAMLKEALQAEKTAENYAGENYAAPPSFFA